MRRIVCVLVFVAVAAIGQQTITGLIPVWSQGRYRFVSIDQLREALRLTEVQRVDFPILAAPVSELEMRGTVLQVYRNGLLQREGVDYSLTSAGIRFEPFPTAAGDLITVFCDAPALPDAP